MHWVGQLALALPQLSPPPLEGAPADPAWVPLVVSSLKWAAQVLLIATGLWALLGAESIRVEPASGRRRLTTNGWTRILLLIVGFALFAATDWQQKTEARKRELLSEKELDDARRELDYMRRLVLTQSKLAGVRLEWTLDDELQRALLAKLAAGAAPRGDLPVLVAAFEGGALEVRRVSGERWALHVEVEREGARFVRRFEQATPEWRAFEAALSSVFEECRVGLTGGALLAEPLGRHWPCRVSKRKGAVLAFEIEEPGLELAALENAALEVVAGPGIERVPGKLRVVSMDRKVQLDQTFVLEWKAEEYESYVDAGARHDSQRLRSRAQAVYAVIVGGM